MRLADSSTKVVYAALVGNVLVAASKFVAAALSGSSAMLTEAIHSTADMANQILLLIGNRRSRTPPDATHAFGYGLEIYFWTFVVAVMVLLAGGVASIYEGYVQLQDPRSIESPSISLVVLALSAIFEGSSLAVGYREYKRIVCGRKIDGEEVGLWRFIALSKDPNLYESLLEDSAALVGILIAAAGVAANAYLDLAWADGAASIAIGVLLVADSYVIALATRSLIAGESVAPTVMEDIRSALRELDLDAAVTDVATLQLGPQDVLVALTMRRDADALSLDVPADLDRITARLRDVDERIRHVVFRLADAESPQDG
jgi:cation diffusion facilitator family transporter